METDPLGRQTSYGYSPRGQIVTTTLPDPDGSGPQSALQITRSFNARGDLVTQTDAMGNTTAWTYNARRQVLTQTDPDPDGAGPLSSPLTSFTYDLAGQRTTVTDPVGNITTSVYDHAGRLVEEIDPRGRSTYFQYNSAGEVTRVVDRNSRKRDFTYNDLGLVTQEAWVDGFGNTVKTVTHVYDDAGREVASADGVTGYQYQYDLADRVIQVDNAGGVVPEVRLDYQYDFEGNRTWMGDSLGGAIGYTWADQRLQSMQMTTEESKAAQVDFTHDSVGRLSSVSRITNENPATIKTAYTLDLLDRVTSITHQKVGASTSTLSQFSYSYDANGRVVSSTGPEGTLSFALDANGQLLSVTGSRTESYGYDANGNRSTSTTGTGNLLLSDGQFNYTYDFEGNRKTRTRLSDGQVTEYYWDHRNQLTLALVKNANGVILKELRFTYDVEGRRVGIWVDADGAGSMAADQVWTVFDGVNPYLDLNAQGQIKTRYLHGPGIDELFARIGAGEDPEWYLTDRLGSVRQIVNGTGTILDEITYDSYGNILTETNPSQGDRFKFTGREFSAELGIYYYRARWYDPTTGQFISQDPIGFRAGDPNLYRYVGNGPGDGTDPSGLQKDLIEDLLEKIKNRDKLSEELNKSDPASLNGLMQEKPIKPEFQFNMGQGIPFPQGGKNNGQEEPWYWDYIHGALDIGGTVEPTPLCDSFNTLLYLTRGKWSDAWITVLGAVPFFDWTKLEKYRKKVIAGKEIVEGSGNSIKKLPKAESPIWNFLESGKKGRKTIGSGNKKLHFEWDHTHGHIEVYDSKGRHLGFMDPLTGQMKGPPVPGRKIEL